MKFNNVTEIIENFHQIEISHFWTKEYVKDLKMHKIHWYPAKFPSFLVNLAFIHAKENGIQIENVVDFFCGCGTTAVESKRSNYNFWGCDINPVATLIAKVKSTIYDENKLNELFRIILEKYDNKFISITSEFVIKERICYWYPEAQIIKLERLLLAIRDSAEGEYLDFFLCAFSNILRGCSRWLTKSIKPQIDPHKTLADVIESFNKQFNLMIKANNELIKYAIGATSNIVVENQSIFDNHNKYDFADLIITSPPYVTSYEYADLHQLSTLWLGCIEDYRQLRKGTVGSLYNANFNADLNCINEIGQNIVNELNDKVKEKAKSIFKYFYDLKKIAEQSFEILKNNSVAYFVIGNTQYNGVIIDNAKYLSSCLLDAGFLQVEAFRREIGTKNLTRNRDSKGKFTTDPNARKVYNIEHVLVAKKGIIS